MYTISCKASYTVVGNLDSKCLRPKEIKFHNLTPTFSKYLVSKHINFQHKSADVQNILNSSNIFTIQYNEGHIIRAEFLYFSPFILMLLTYASDIIQRDSCISVKISQFYLSLALASVACNRLSRVVLSRPIGPVLLHTYPYIV